MKENKKTIETIEYIAFDGTVFYERQACLDYENENENKNSLIKEYNSIVICELSHEAFLYNTYSEDVFDVIKIKCEHDIDVINKISELSGINQKLNSFDIGTTILVNRGSKYDKYDEYFYEITTIDKILYDIRKYYDLKLNDIENKKEK